MIYYTQSGRQTGRQTHRQAGRQETHRHTGRQAGRQAGRFVFIVTFTAAARDAAALSEACFKISLIGPSFAMFSAVLPS